MTWPTDKNGAGAKPEVLHYVLYVRVPVESPGNKILTVQEKYPNDSIRLIESDDRGTVYRVESPLPGRL